MDKKPSIFNLTLAELEGWMAPRGEPAYRAKQVFQWLYQKRIFRFHGMSDLSERLRDELERQFNLDALPCARKTGSSDNTQKFLFALRDNNFIESVLIPASPALYGTPSDRKTICVS